MGDTEQAPPCLHVSYTLVMSQGRTTQPTLFSNQPVLDSNFQSICDALLCLSTGPAWPDSFGSKLREYIIRQSGEPIRTISLFSGAGGLDIGFHDAGFSVVAAIEIEEKYVESLQANSQSHEPFDSTSIHCMDIREFDTHGLSADMVVGGPPCQPFSAAGRRAAGVAGTSDEKGMLFTEYIRILAEISPKAFLFENVYGITGAEDGGAWKTIKDEFSKLGYQTTSRILDAADYGTPQHRERLFIVGIKDKQFQFPMPTHGPDSPGGNDFYVASEAVKDVELSEEERTVTIGGRYGHLLNGIPPGLNYSFYTERMGHPQPVFAWRSKFSDFLYKADPDSPVRTIKANGGLYTGPFHWDSRPFSLAELKRLQTFPDSYTLVGGKQAVIQQIGNSVPPQLARMLALAVAEQAFNAEPAFKLPLLQVGQELGFRKRKRKLTALYRQKAEDAIRGLKVEKREIEGREYIAVLGKNFGWREVKPDCKLHDLLHVGFAPTESVWQIRVSSSRKLKSRGFRITVSPSSGSTWILPVTNVSLIGAEVEEGMFTAIWKAFEAEIARNGFKADLVQLSNYYQYRPRFAAQLEFDIISVSAEWRTLQRVVEGRGVRQILPLGQLAEIWQIREAEILSFAHWLKGLGYEVRDSRTNVKMPKKHMLIPYSFPTLASASVQRGKALEEAHEP